MRVLMADDDPKVRSALRLLMEQQLGASVFREVDNAGSLLQAVVEQPPDLLLLDWDLPGLRQPALLLAHLRRGCPHLKVIALGGQLEMRALAIALGADAFVSKTDPPECLLAALQLFWKAP